MHTNAATERAWDHFATLLESLPSEALVRIANHETHALPAIARRMVAEGVDVRDYCRLELAGRGMDARGRAIGWEAAAAQYYGGHDAGESRRQQRGHRQASRGDQ